MTPDEEEEYLALLETEARERAEDRQRLWLMGCLEWKLDAHQREIYRLLEQIPPDKQNEILFLCSRQWGKSYFNLILALEHAIRHPGIQVRIGAPTKLQAQEIIEANLVPIIADAPKGLVLPARSEKTWRIANGSSIKVGAMERAHVDSMRGPNSPLIILEEGVALESDDYVHAMGVVIPQQTRHVNSRLIHVTSAPEDPEHYILSEVAPKCEIDGTLFKRTIWQNTAITREQILKIAEKMPGGLRGEKFRREYEVEIFRTLSLIVVPEYDEAIHLSTHEPKHGNYLVATDFGGVRDKTVGLLIAYDFERNTKHFLNEFVADSNTGTKDIVAGLIGLEPFEVDRVVDAPGQLLIDLTTEHKYLCRQTPKDDWLAQLNNLRTGFTRRDTFVHPRCKFLRATLKAGTFNKNRTDFARTTALGHMDAIAAATYGYRNIDTLTNPIPRRALTPEEQVETFWDKQAENIQQKETREWWDQT
jgi:hypothetical protein